MISANLPGRAWRQVSRFASTEWHVAASNFREAELSLFHDFAPPPTGGGHQFLRALQAAFEVRGLRVENNTISRSTRGCLFNSFNFDPLRLRRFRRAGCRMVHRVDGVVALYRGMDDGTDRMVAALNAEFADVTVFQSRFSLEAHQRQGFVARQPVVIHNAPDPRLFNQMGRVALAGDRPVRLIAASWSDNPRKGADVLARLGDILDPARYEFTFVGRSPHPFRRARVLPPVASATLATLFRQHDIYIAASLDDSCSNALLEALACGLPALYRRSGGHPELVGDAGLGFDDVDEIPALLGTLVSDYAHFQARIRVPRIDTVAGQYLSCLLPGDRT